jgi:hypothetical protein
MNVASIGLERRLSVLGDRDLLLAATSVASAQNLLRNGGFEDGEPAGGFNTYYGGPLGIPGLRVTGDSVDHIRGYWNAASGLEEPRPNCGSTGGVAQSIDSHPLPGTRCRHLRDGRQSRLGLVGQVRESSRGSMVSEPFTFDGTGRTRSDMGWSVRQWQFVATDLVTEIELFSTVFGGPGDPPSTMSRSRRAVGAAIDPLVTACRGRPVPVDAVVAGVAPFDIRCRSRIRRASTDGETSATAAIVIDGFEWQAADVRGDAPAHA